MVVVKAAGQGSGVKKVKVKKITKHANNSIHLLVYKNIAHAFING